MAVCNYLQYFLGKRDLLWCSLTPLPVYLCKSKPRTIIKGGLAGTKEMHKQQGIPLLILTHAALQSIWYNMFQLMVAVNATLPHACTYLPSGNEPVSICVTGKRMWQLCWRLVSTWCLVHMKSRNHSYYLVCSDWEKKMSMEPRGCSAGNGFNYFLFGRAQATALSTVSSSFGMQHNCCNFFFPIVSILLLVAVLFLNRL